MLPSSICHWPMRRCCRTSLLRIKARYSVYIPWAVSWPLSRLVSDDAERVRRDISWSEYFPFLPMIDMDPTNMSCIFLHSYLALRYGATPVLIFDQPCGGKPRRSLTMSHLTVSHGPSSYGLGDSTQKWAFLAAWDDWRQDRAFNNCWKCSLIRILSHTCWLQGHRQSSSRTFSCRCCP